MSRASGAREKAVGGNVQTASPSESRGASRAGGSLPVLGNGTIHDQKVTPRDQQLILHERRQPDRERNAETKKEVDERAAAARKLNEQFKNALNNIKEKELELRNRQIEHQKLENALKEREAACANAEAEVKDREKCLQKTEEEVLGSIAREFAAELEEKWTCAL